MKNILKGINSLISFIKFEANNHNLPLSLQKKIYAKNPKSYMSSTKDIFYLHKRNVNEDKKMEIDYKGEKIAFYSMEDTTCFDEKLDIKDKRIIKENYLKETIFNKVNTHDMNSYVKLLCSITDTSKEIKEDLSELYKIALESKLARSSERSFNLEINEEKVFNLYQKFDKLNEKELEDVFSKINANLKIGCEFLIKETQALYENANKKERENSYDIRENNKDGQQASTVQVSNAMEEGNRNYDEAVGYQLRYGDRYSLKEGVPAEAEHSEASEPSGASRRDQKASNGGHRVYRPGEPEIRRSESSLFRGELSTDASGHVVQHEPMGAYNEAGEPALSEGRGDRSLSDERTREDGDAKIYSVHGRVYLKLIGEKVQLSSKEYLIKNIDLDNKTITFEEVLEDELFLSVFDSLTITESIDEHKELLDAMLLNHENIVEENNKPDEKIKETNLEEETREDVSFFNGKSDILENRNLKLIIEANEYDSKYDNKVIDINLIDELELLDINIRDQNLEYDRYAYEPDDIEYLGYFKFYIKIMDNDNTLDEMRIDIGDGNLVNKEYFDYLRNIINNKELSINHKDNILEFSEHKQSEMNKAYEERESMKILKEEYVNSADLFEKKSKAKRIEDNLKAISFIKGGEFKENRQLQLDILRGYTGFGGLVELFDERNQDYDNKRNMLKDILDKQEYMSLKESSLTAYYTEPYVIDSMYDILSHIGFKGGMILEPSAGMGSFIDNMPAEVKEKSAVVAIEKDRLTASLLKEIYKDDDKTLAVNSGFENAPISDNNDKKFDLAISNIPFGEFSVYDPRYEENYLIHDYFFIKSLDMVREGGLIAFITSNGTLDKKNTKLREQISKKAEFLGAIRLPNKVFQASGAFITTDIIFLQRTNNPQNINDFINVKVDDNGLEYNEYFINNPQMLAGIMSERTNRYGRKLAVLSEDKSYNHESYAKNIAEALFLSKEALKSKILTDFPKIKDTFIISNEAEDIKSSDIKAEDINTTLENDLIDYAGNIELFSLFLYKDKIYIKESEEDVFEYEEVFEKRGGKKKRQAALLYIKIRDELKEYISICRQSNEDADFSKELSSLNEKFDTFTKNFKSFYSLAKVLSIDKDYPLVASLEELDKDKIVIGKAPILKKRVIFKDKEITYAENSMDGLYISLSEKGCVDIEYIASLTGFEKQKVLDDLKQDILIDTDNLSIHNDMTKENVIYSEKEEYLSGNIKNKINNLNNKLDSLENLLSDENLDYIKRTQIQSVKDKLEAQRVMLQESLPEKIQSEDIAFSLSSNFIDAEYKTKFIKSLEKNAYSEAKVIYNRHTNSYDIVNFYFSSDIRFELQSKTISAENMLLRCLNNIKSPVIIEGQIDRAESIKVEEKMRLIEEKFYDFMMSDNQRREYLAESYNDKFNVFVERKYNGAYLSFKNMSSDITLNDHQKDAIARVLNQGNALLAHCVGAGKTFEMIASIMESKRIGLSKKAMMVVPNHLVEQTASEFLRLYPQANILTVDPKIDLKNQLARKIFTGRIVHSDMDCIIVTHNQFEKFPMSKGYVEDFINSEIDKLENYLKEENKNNNSKKTVRDIQIAITRLKAKLQALSEKKEKDYFVNFEDLNIDKLVVDEAHAFKNLETVTRYGQVSGINSKGSVRSFDMLLKTNYLNEVYNERAVIFATATPVTNSMTELYTITRYLKPSLLDDMDFIHFDAFINHYANMIMDSEISVDGKNFKIKPRFKFHNVNELVTMFRSYADVKTKEMLNLPLPKVNYHVIESEPSYYQKQMLNEITERCEKVSSKGNDPREDNMLSITNDGKMLAIDHRLIDSSLADFEGSKVNMLCQNVYRIYKESDDVKGCQLIFSDTSVPSKSFNIYDDIKSKLISMGIDEKEIAFIHDAKTQAAKETLFEQVRNANVRVLLGSTQKLGTGTNVQNRLVASHDLDVPWRPADLEQRAGRIERRGNENENVDIFRYVTKATLDAYSWQTIESKLKFINDIMTGKIKERSMDDISDNVLTASEIKAIATGNPLMQEKVTLDNEIARLNILKKNHIKDLNYKRYIREVYPKKIKEYEGKINNITKDLNNISKYDNKDFNITIRGIDYTDKKEAIKALRAEYNTLNMHEKVDIGSFKGFNFSIEKSSLGSHYKIEAEHKYFTNFNNDNLILQRLIDTVNEKKIISVKENFEVLKEDLSSKLSAANKDFDETFKYQSELDLKNTRLNEVLYLIKTSKNEHKEYIASSNFFNKRKENLSFKENVKEHSLEI